MPRKVAIDLRRWKTVEASKSKMLPRVKQVYLLLRTADRSLSWAEYFLEVLSFACEHAQEVVSPTSKRHRCSGPGSTFWGNAVLHVNMLRI